MVSTQLGQYDCVEVVPRLQQLWQPDNPARPIKAASAGESNREYMECGLLLVP
jgi:hypothetical protein